MNKSLRKAIIAGNWKMNKTRPEAKELLEAIKPLVANADGKVEVIACVPFTNLETAINTTAGSNVKIGAENVHFEKAVHLLAKFQLICWLNLALNTL